MVARMPVRITGRSIGAVFKGLALNARHVHACQVCRRRYGLDASSSLCLRSLGCFYVFRRPFLPLFAIWVGFYISRLSLSLSIDLFAASILGQFSTDRDQSPHTRHKSPGWAHGGPSPPSVLPTNYPQTIPRIQGQCDTVHFHHQHRSVSVDRSEITCVLFGGN